MPIKKYLFFACLFVTIQSKAQNLVPNPSFELYTLCPTITNHLGQNNNLARFCNNWESLGTVQEYANSSNIWAQYANACANNFDKFVSIPRNNGGFQYAKTGNAFIINYCSVLGNKHNRIFQGVNLLAPMQRGRQYLVSFYINLMDTSDQACNNIGITFFTQKPTIIDTSSPTSQFYPNRAHVYCKDIITDTAQWVKISDIITADSAYTYLAVGNFFNFDKTQYKTLSSNHQIGFPQLFSLANYYLDDFNVEAVNKNIQNTNPIVCKGSSKQIEATGLATNYYWSLNKTDVYSKNEKISLKVDSNQTVYLVTPWSIDSLQLVAVDAPQKTIPTDTSICLENYFEINGKISNASYEWNTGETTGNIRVDKSGLYVLKTTKGNCYRLDTTEVNFCEPTIFIPNAFTPNGDGLNDVFKPLGNQVRNYNFEIYSSWGQLLFQSNNINNGWDGNQYPSGVYFYSIVFTNDTEKKKYRYGSTFNLIR